MESVLPDAAGHRCVGARTEWGENRVPPVPERLDDQAMTLMLPSLTSVPERTEFGISAIASTCATSSSS